MRLNYTVKKFRDTFKLKWDDKECMRIGKHLSKLCKEQDIEISKEYDGKYDVNAYPIGIWTDVMTNHCVNYIKENIQNNKSNNMIQNCQKN